MSETSPRALTFQEKVQRKRRNKTPTSSATTSPDGTLTPSPSKMGSPHKAQIKNQLEKAMGMPSQTNSAVLATENRHAVSSQLRGGRRVNEQGYSLQQVDSPLATMDDTFGVQNNGGISKNQEASQSGSALNEAPVSRPKPAPRRKLPKWPPDPEPAGNEINEPPASQQQPDEEVKARQKREDIVETEPTTTVSDLSSIGKAPWLRTSPRESNKITTKNVNGGKPSWARNDADEETQSEETGPSPTVGQQRAPWEKQRVQSPLPSEAAESQQKPPWARQQAPSPAPDTVNNSLSRQKTPWARMRAPSPSSDTSNGVDDQTQQVLPGATNERTPSPVPFATNMYSQQKAPWVRPQRSQSPASQDTETPPTSQQQKFSWKRASPAERVPSPVPTNVSDGSSSQQKAPWARPPARARTPSPLPGAAASMYSQQKAPWVRPADRERTQSPVSVEEAAAGTEGVADEILAESVSPQEEDSVTKPPARVAGLNGVKPRSVKKWPPVRTEPFPNGYKQQQVAKQKSVVENSVSAMNDPPVEEGSTEHAPMQPSSTVNETIVTSTTSDEAQSSAVKKAPWLRTSPVSSCRGGISNDEQPSRSRSLPQEKASAPESLAQQQRKAWDRRSPSPVPTDEGGPKIATWTESTARAIPQPSSQRESDEQLVKGSAHKKPPPAPHYGTSKYVPPWVKAAESKPSPQSLSNNQSDRLRSPTAPLHDDLDPVPSDEILSPPQVRSGRKQSIESPPSPSSKILNEVKTRRHLMNDDGGDGFSEELDRSDEVAEVVVSHGGAVIETPKAINVANMASSFASGERFSPPGKKKSWKNSGTLQENSKNRASDLLMSKQSASPGDRAPDQPARSPWKRADDAAGKGSSWHQSPEKSKRNREGQWAQVHSPPPLWSKEGRSGGKQGSSKPPTSQRELSTIESPKLASRRETYPQRQTPVRSPPPTWINRGVSPGDSMSTIRTPQWASKPAQSQKAPLERSPPPAWVNRDVSQGELSSIKSPDWDRRGETAKVSPKGSHPPSWVDRDAHQDELSPIESPRHASNQRVVRITVETVDDESANEEGSAQQWSPRPQTDEYVYGTEDEEEEAYDMRAITGDDVDEDGMDYFSRTQRDVDDESNDRLDMPSDQFPPKSPSKSLAQMAMDSVFALDFDLALSQTAKEPSYDDDDESSGSSPSKGIAKSTPPERELPEEVKAMLERSLNRALSDSHDVPTDSEAYEADYFSTDLDTSALDETGSTWNENDISALSDGSGLAPLSPSRRDVNHSPPRVRNARWSPTAKDGSQSSPSPRAPRALHFSGDESPANSNSNGLSEAALPRVRDLKDIRSNDEPKSDDNSESSDLYNALTRRIPDDHTPKVVNRETLDRWSGGRATPAPKLEKERKNTLVLNIEDDEANDSTIDLGSPVDFSIQVSPDSPRQTSLVGTSPALLSDSPPDDFPGRKTVRFGEPELYGEETVDVTANKSEPKKPTPSESNSRRVTVDWPQEDVPGEPQQTISARGRSIEEQLQDNKREIPSPPPPEHDLSPASAGANRVLKYFGHETHEASRMADSEAWNQRDPDLDELMSNATETEIPNGQQQGHVDWRQRSRKTPSPTLPPTSNSNKTPSTTWSSRGFPDTRTPDPFSTQDDRDSFFKQDDPFAASKSGSADFTSDFGGGFNPFADATVDEAFDFEKEEAAVAATEFFSPYGDAPKVKSGKGTATTSPSPARLTPSRRDRRRREASAERYDDYYAQKATSFAPTSTSLDDYDEYYAQQASYAPTPSTEISSKDGTYLLEI